MIIVKLGGGLGNQLCQYACGRSLSIKNNDVLKLDIETYTPTYPRKYGLGDFNIQETFATPEEIQHLKLPHGFLSRCIRSFKARILRIQNIGYNPRIMNLTGDIYLDGFWKNEMYWNNIKDTILQEFTLKKSLSLSAEEIKKLILATSPSVSLHVRRGDYVTDNTTTAYHGICSPEYYASAISIIKAKYPNASLFVFSDDIEWVKQNMKFDLPTNFVSHQSISDHEELMLMSYCQHNIIANSTFSWWGAWLNQNPNKTIIAPKKWLTKTGNDYYKEIPPSWIKI